MEEGFIYETGEKVSSYIFRIRLTALLLALVMFTAMLPEVVHAATVKITPTAKTLYVGESMTLKAKGSYKKISWKSNNAKVASVSKTGVVKAKKTGTAKVTATFTLNNKKTAKCTCTIKVISADAGKMVKVTDASDSIAQEIAEYLSGNIPFSLLVKGKKADAVSTVKSLQEKVGRLNEYGVQFQYKDVTAYNDGWLFRMTKDRCELYNYSVSFIKQVYKQTMDTIFWGVRGDNDAIIHTGEEQIAFVRTFDTWEAYAAVAETCAAY